MYCNYCAKPVTGNLVFCCDEHKENFQHAKENNLSIPLRITEYPELTIYTKAYDNIPAIIAKYMGNKEDITLGTDKLKRYSTPKGKIKANTPEEPLF